MYLARLQKKAKTSYVIRQSYADGELLRSRDLFNLGENPAAFIVYVGGTGYYYADVLQEALAAASVAVDYDQLDQIFFEFMEPRVQRVIDGFDRSRRDAAPRAIAAGATTAIPHLFDKRRYHYLRFGHSAQRHIHRVSENVFSPLHTRSRDELEQYFLAEERRLGHHEQAQYVATIFELSRFRPDSAATATPLAQVDAHFLARLCQLDADAQFWAGAPFETRLRDYLVRYAILYFDTEPPRRFPWQSWVDDFIRRHRAYQPPRQVRIQIEEAGRLFELSWNELKKLEKRSLTQRYRRLALKHHPDQGGDPELFRRLTHYYQVLLKK